jgi:hypothetical protein
MQRQKRRTKRAARVVLRQTSASRVVWQVQGREERWSARVGIYDRGTIKRGSPRAVDQRECRHWSNAVWGWVSIREEDEVCCR